MENKNSQDENSIEVRCYFVRHRNALAVRGNFGPIYMDHYLHLMQHQIRTNPDNDQKLKDALAGIALHLASRPWDEVSAWTIHFSDPLMNLFVTGNSNEGNIIGRTFTKGIRDDKRNLFITQINNFPKEPRRSAIDFKASASIFQIIQEYYKQSEQRLVKFFNYSEEEFVFISAQPECDEDWLLSLNDEAIRSLDKDEELSLLEKRHYSYRCGCTKERIITALATTSKDEVLGNKESVNIECPRCAAITVISSKDFDQMKDEV
ncbi:MAG: Hsp33 family molecular chaperone HslO [Verrucomicrobiota bacterium]|nr:Hsp33 family molecular chaperone HslO [Verrucomicrobiota bacterium]